MIIFPAIDIKDGNCVRLYKGDYATAHKVAEDAVDTAKKFEADGAQWLHVVDLDGAKDGKLVNSELILNIRKNCGMKIEVGGGIREMAAVDFYLNSGIEWVESAILFESGLDHYVDRIVVVTAPEALRIARIMERDGITKEKAQEWIDHQLPQDYLVRHADLVIVNDEQTPLLPQLEAFPFMQQ